jgi:hypothetical protein
MTLASRLLESALEGMLRKAAQQRRGPRPETRAHEGHVQGSPGEHEDGSGDGHFEEGLDGGESGAAGEPDSRRDQDWFFDPRPDEAPQSASDTHEDVTDEDESSDEPSDRRRVSGRALVAGAAILALLAVTAVLVRAAVIRPDPATVQASPTQTRAAVPPAPAGAPEEGSFSESRVTANGEVRVQQWVRSSAPMFGLRLATPPGLVGPGPTKVTDLFVASNQSVLNQPTTLGPLGHRLFFDAPPVLVYVRYTLRGAVDLSPSVPGRALARATALDVLRSPQTGPSQVTVVGDGIRSVACASPGTGVLTPCGTEGKGRWTVLLRGAAREAAVVAQVDLS